MTHAPTEASSNPLYGTTSIGIQCQGPDYIVALHVPDFQIAQQIRNYLSALLTSADVTVPPASKTTTDLAYVTAQRDIAWGAIQTIKHGPPTWIGVSADDILSWAQSEADKGLAAV